MNSKYINNQILDKIRDKFYRNIFACYIRYITYDKRYRKYENNV